MISETIGEYKPSRWTLPIRVTLGGHTKPAWVAITAEVGWSQGLSEYVQFTRDELDWLIPLLQEARERMETA